MLSESPGTGFKRVAMASRFDIPDVQQIPVFPSKRAWMESGEEFGKKSKYRRYVKSGKSRAPYGSIAAAKRQALEAVGVAKRDALAEIARREAWVESYYAAPYVSLSTPLLDRYRGETKVIKGRGLGRHNKRYIPEWTRAWAAVKRHYATVDRSKTYVIITGTK